MHSVLHKTCCAQFLERSDPAQETMQRIGASNKDCKPKPADFVPFPRPYPT